MTIAKRMSLWLREFGGAYCDNCLAAELKLSRPQEAGRVARALSKTANFYRERGICSLCGAEKKVTTAL